ncbi:MAG: sensor histidine kinase [Firmicutes bacterium]|nr:sensor histidine kinase [Bacillota bacterium]
MSYRNSRDKKPERLYAGILRLLVMSWLLPLVLIGAVVFYVLSHQIERQSAEEMQRAMDTAAEICEGKLKDTIRASRNASYVPTIKESWEAYQKKGDSQELYENVYRFISTFYNYDENLCSSMVYFCEKPERLYISYSGKIGADYESVRFFKQNAWENVRALAETIDTRIGFYHCMGHLYLVRNIVNHDFVPVAVIVLELDCEEIFQGLEGIAWHEDAFVWIDGENVTGRTVPEGWPADEVLEADVHNSVYLERGTKSFVYRSRMLEGHKISYLVELDHDTIHSERVSMSVMLILAVLFTLPLMAFLVLFLYRHVNAPVLRLVEAFQKIEKGNFGCRIGQQEESEEFMYLTEAFNRMSEKLKTQFEQIYLEELALKDANIKALQSQINPHFLNNTLEIINWEARMDGNEKVSSMIEALSTMLEATLNRKKQPMIPLREELAYVDAYCCIIKQRFGEKICFEKELDESLLEILVPRLIIQPIIENAVEHGRSGIQAKIVLNIFRDGNRLVIRVINDGVLTKEDRERIDQLLDGRVEAERSVSLGIRNVNKRLKIIYGESFGLTIKNDNEGHTVSTLVVGLQAVRE